MEMKKCCHCGFKKEITNFDKNRRMKDGHNNMCKICRKEYDRLYRMTHQEQIKKYRLLNSQKHKKEMKKWHDKNKEKEEEYRISYRERRKYLNKKWREENLEKSREWNRNYRREKRKDELNYAKDRIRNLINHSLRRKGYSKKTKTYEILGEEYNNVWEYLKQTWYENYGSIYNNEPYEIDHIMPLSTAKTEEEIIVLCHYTNLQMLTPEDNLRKSNKII